MKFGLNFHKPTSDTNLPSNICFNANVPNEKLLLKSGTFRWCTIFDAFQKFIYITHHLSSGFNDAEIFIEVYREMDGKFELGYFKFLTTEQLIFLKVKKNR